MGPVNMGKNILSSIDMIGHGLQRNHFRKIYNIRPRTNINRMHILYER